MKRFILCSVFLFASAFAFGQGSNYPISGIYVLSAPSGSCSGNVLEYVLVSGTIYSCQNGTWAQAGSGGSGTVTVVSSGALGNTQLVTGGGTTTLQTACATCTLSSGGALSLPADATINGATVGLGGGSVFSNTALGVLALAYGGGSVNTAVGYEALLGSINIAGNTGVGSHALGAASLGSNTALGASAGYCGTALGAGTGNLFLGVATCASTATDTNEIVMAGNGVTGNGSNTTTIGNSSTTATYFPAGVLNVAGSAGISSSGILCSSTFTTVGGVVTACSAVSDRRLKENIRRFPYGLKAVMKLRPHTWNFTNEAHSLIDGLPQGTRVGPIAQDFARVMPEYVSTEEHGGKEYKSIPQVDAVTISALGNAVQEQQKEIESLKAMITTLTEVELKAQGELLKQ